MNKAPNPFTTSLLVLVFGLIVLNIYNFTASSFAQPLDQIESQETQTTRLAKLAIESIDRFSLPDFVWPEVKFPQFVLPSLTMPEIHLPTIDWPEINLPDMKFPSFDLPAISFEFPDFAASLEAAKSRMRFFNPVHTVAALEPSSGEEVQAEVPRETEPETEENEMTFQYEIEEPSISAEAVLVPARSTVISSSRDGKITKIHFDNGDVFSKGDVLLEYDCRDIEAEFAALDSEESLSRKKALRSVKLLKLEIISDVENLTLQTEQKKAEAQKQAIQQRLESCYIQAEYDGRVTNRLANPGEYTRTDRVLMEVASREQMEAEFLLPSRWLRWINTGAPVSVEIAETGKTYEAVINQIHGEIDPVSQSIQMSAALNVDKGKLLPGMSGEITLNVEDIREAGIRGFLDEGE